MAHNKWPRHALLSDFWALLRKGTPRPAPGCDQWEKWVIKNLPDRALGIVLRLHNYIVTNTRFPGNLKDMWLTMFHKHGLHTDLTNWRGLLISNFLANSPMSHSGCNAASISCWAKRHKVTVYALKHDQMKGFDYLSPQGMYDAVSAYGLPSAIIDLDHAAQTDTKCYICTAHGITKPILITGLTKQGGSLSPVKSTLTTSLGHHYPNDLSANDPDTLIVSTANGLKGDPHLADNHLSCKVIMVEATDNSYLFARSLTALQRNALAMEHFQFAYGWLTQWTKLMAYVLEPSSDPPAFADFESVTTTTGANPLNITTHCVALRSNELDFLRTLVDDPHSRYEELKEFIQHFTFPKFLRHPPITLLRKILKQNVVSKARALISLQPIKRADADKLDKILKMLIHQESGMPFEPNPDVLMLPTEFHSLDFPSIGHVNNTAAVNGLHCDLNHPIASYRMMARITLMDWTCTINNCINPLDGHSL
ncbi:hypothetical protein DFH08DRAFT_1033376 [Mycena albidolilacea]|uniref:Uncharacterized protein n=1 Tax=Mycena albidolilacea TaxID=1033008 RepID=A0AAD7AL89_9AGAR|nr:hypothetical protein DFH08DRAFT_1033376 [Mycena albidolilacea]